ncbi:MAG: hypothetical protein HYX78_06740 [Armatimonadetes bacterium]|nr:hypothetical protein [Armatimonadota bacterium]
MLSSFIPSGIYQFKKPGIYSVRIMLLGPPGKITSKPSDLGPVVAEVTIPVSVRPFDEKRLRERCDELIEPRMLHPSNLKDFPPHENMMALWSVRHNAALPTLKFVAEHWGEYSCGWPTAVAIRRIGTPESAALLKAIGSRTDRMGQCARSAGATKFDANIHEHNYFAGWTNVNSPEATVNLFLYYFRNQQWDPAEKLFSDYFRRKHADDLKNGSLFTSRAGKHVQRILNEPGSKVLRSRKQGKFVIVDVGREARGDGEQIGVVQLRLVGRREWHLSDFPGSASE